MQNKIFFIAFALILLFIIIFSGVKANTVEEFIMYIAFVTFLVAFLFMALIGFELAMNILSKFDSDVRTIVATSSVIIGTVTVIGELKCKGIPIVSAVVVILAVMGVINILKQAHNVLATVIRRTVNG